MAESNNNIELVVVESKISMGGVARIHVTVLNRLGLKSGDHAVVRCGQRSIIVKVFGDSIIDEGEISLRVKDRRRLGVREGDYVTIEPYIKLKDTIVKKLGIFNRFQS